MPSRIEQRLAEMGLELPTPAAPAANYIPWTRAGDIVHIAGQVPFENGVVTIKGRVGEEVSIEDGQRAARLCALNILAQVKAACDGDLDRVVRCLKLGGFVNAAPRFADHPKVINGASDLIVAVLGDAGRHARFAVGAGSLPLDCAVEVEAVFQVR